jgi:hypothetical protein
MLLLDPAEVLLHHILQEMHLFLMVVVEVLLQHIEDLVEDFLDYSYLQYLKQIQF